MAAVIAGVDAGSPAARAGVAPGETLLSVSGRPIRDVLDYRFYTYDARLDVELEAPNGARRFLAIRKAEGEDLGLAFETYLMDAQRPCRNRCIFCFVDQLPRGLRPSLYFKDDDARLSFLLGQYITLTNLTEDELLRIMEQRVSPLHVSVHAADPDVRKKLMGHPRAGDCLARMTRLAAAGISMHTQVVVCPGLNDGAVLQETLTALTALYPAVLSVAVVPVGLTEHRDGLFPLIPFDREKALHTLGLVEAHGAACRAQYGVSLSYASDELYLLAGRAIPGEDAYDGYPQLENGVGMMRLFETEFFEALAALPSPVHAAPFTLVTGLAAAPFLTRLTEAMAARMPGLDWAVAAVPNMLFGGQVDVAGLLGGRDVVHALRGRVGGRRVLIPQSMLRHDGDVFLDDLSPEDVSKDLGAPVIPVAVDGGALVQAMLGGNECA